MKESHYAVATIVETGNDLTFDLAEIESYELIKLGEEDYNVNLNFKSGKSILVKNAMTPGIWPEDEVSVTVDDWISSL